MMRMATTCVGIMCGRIQWNMYERTLGHFLSAVKSGGLKGGVKENVLKVCCEIVARFHYGSANDAAQHPNLLLPGTQPPG